MWKPRQLDAIGVENPKQNGLPEFAGRVEDIDTAQQDALQLQNIKLILLWQFVRFQFSRSL